MAAEDKVRYERELKEWKMKNGEVPNGSTKGQGKAMASHSSAEKKPGHTSSFMIFCAEKREELKRNNQTIKPVEVSQIAGQAWKALSEQEKQVYKQRADAQNAQNGYQGGKSSGGNVNQKRVLLVSPTTPQQNYQ